MSAALGAVPRMRPDVDSSPPLRGLDEPDDLRRELDDLLRDEPEELDDLLRDEPEELDDLLRDEPDELDDLLREEPDDLDRPFPRELREPDAEDRPVDLRLSAIPTPTIAPVS
jgi:hypothetical protein